MTIRLRLPFSLAALDWTSHILVVCGLAGIGVFVWSRSEGWVYQRVQTAHFERSIAAPAAVTVEPARTPEPRRAVAKRPRMLAPDPAVLGEIEVPRLGVRAIVRDGSDPASLRRAVGHVSGSALPGAQGNSVIAGHRDTFFRALRRAERGDEIRLRLRNATVRYAIDSLVIVAPDAVEVMQPSEQARLTLITCYPFDWVGPAPRRMVIGAHALTK
ncbi:MAG: class D sortase [Bryobacteraceae bacterium]